MLQSWNCQSAACLHFQLFVYIFISCLFTFLSAICLQFEFSRQKPCFPMTFLPLQMLQHFNCKIRKFQFSAIFQLFSTFEGFFPHFLDIFEFCQDFATFSNFCTFFEAFSMHLFLEFIFLQIFGQFWQFFPEFQDLPRSTFPNF